MEKIVRRVFIGCIVLASLLIGSKSAGDIDGSRQIVMYERPEPTVSINYVMASMEFYPTDEIESDELIEVEEVEEQQTKEESKSYSDDDLYWLSRIVSAEAKGESEKGQIAVANVVLNRVEHESFPDSIKDVVFEKGQFSPVNDKSIYNEPTADAVESTIKALEGEVVVDEDVLFFYNPKIAPNSWASKRKEATTIGNHRFTY